MIKGSPDKLLVRFKKQFPPADYEVLKQSERLKPFCNTTLEAVCHGFKGAVYDVQLYAREWDFSMDEIKMPLTWFHGEQDRNVPVAQIKRVVASLPTVNLVTYPQEGHVSLIINQLETIVKALMN